MKRMMWLIALMLLAPSTWAQLNCSGGTFACGTTATPQFLRLGLGAAADAVDVLHVGFGIAHFAGNTQVAVPNASGLYLDWNRSNGGGESDFISHYDGATKGFYWYTTNSGTLSNPLMAMDSSGNLAIGNNFTAPLSLVSVNGNGATGYTLYVNSGTSGLNGRVYMGALTTSAAVQTDYLCLASTGEVIADTGLCLASTAKVKNWLSDMTCLEVQRIISGMRPGWFQYKNEGMPPERADWSIHAGFLAEDVEKVEPRLVNYSRDGEVRGVQYDMYAAILTKFLQCGR